MSDKFKNFKGSSLPIGRLAAGVALLAWAASGVFIIAPGEEGVVLRFGAYDRTVGAGPHYCLPYPVESITKLKVNQVRRIEVGFRSSARAAADQTRMQPVPVEASMLTSDENIVSVQFTVQYSIRPDTADHANAKQYLFNLDRQADAVKSASEAAMRAVIGRYPIDVPLTGGKLTILNETKRDLQKILDQYEFGVEILTVEMRDVHTPDEVMVALKDVSSAKEEKSRTINEAEAYQNDILPKARGRAAEIVNAAEAYKATTLRRAEGESKRFLAVLAEYNNAKDATKTRLYIEAMEHILAQPGLEKLVISKDAASHTLPLLPLTPQGEQK